MRRLFADELYKQMAKNKDIWLIVGDLGYKMFDKIKEDFPDRFLNVGAAEQAMMGIAVGLAMKGKIPFVYSITSFLLRRPFETIKLYIDYEKIPVKLIGGGRDKDYEHDGISHWSEDAKDILGLFKNIKQYWPETKEEIPNMANEMITNNKPSFISLKR
jgi:transketolase